MHTNKRKVWQPLIYAAILTIGLAGGFFLQNRNGADFKLSGNDKIDQVIGLINSSYADTFDNNKLTEAAIVEMLHKLDPHSNYIPAQELKGMNEQLEGNFEGIGVEFNLMDDTIFIATVLNDGPAEKAGLMPGDRILKVDGENVAGINIGNDGVVKRFKGEKGTKVKVTILRMGEKKLLDYTIIRGKIPLYSVEAAYMLNQTAGYIKLVSFSKDTYQELTNAIKQLKEKGMQELVLDLRGNPGGFLHAATGVTSEFLGKNKLMVYTEGRKQAKKEYKTDSEGSFTKGKLVILIDEGSASASEIVSGAVQDWDRGIIVGRRSYGKGLVQEPFQLKDGSAVRLTVARYFTPTGRCIQKPYNNGYDDYEAEISERFEHGETENPDSVKKDPSLQFKTPSGRIVYGGGGVYPDVFVPLDSNLRLPLLGKLLQYGFISRISYKYATANRKSLLIKYKNSAAFVKQFDATTELLPLLTNLLTEGKINYTQIQLQAALPLVNRYAKAYIARQLYGRPAYYEALNEGDLTLATALKAILQHDAVLNGSSALLHPLK